MKKGQDIKNKKTKKKSNLSTLNSRRVGNGQNLKTQISEIADRLEALNRGDKLIFYESNIDIYLQTIKVSDVCDNCFQTPSKFGDRALIVTMSEFRFID